MDGDHFNHGERPSLWERLGALAGHTTYREPVGGRTSRHNAIPADHELCIALGWARRRDDPCDIGPDIAFDIATRSPRHRQSVCKVLAMALVSDDSRWRRVIRRNRIYMRVVAHGAYMRAVYDESIRIPDGMDSHDWLELTEAGFRVLVRMAEDAVDRAARKMRRDA